VSLLPQSCVDPESDHSDLVIRQWIAEEWHPRGALAAETPDQLTSLGISAEQDRTVVTARHGTCIAIKAEAPRRTLRPMTHYAVLSENDLDV
jgi:hypothetical protein